MDGFITCILLMGKGIVQCISISAVVEFICTVTSTFREPNLIIVTHLFSFSCTLLYFPHVRCLLLFRMQPPHYFSLFHVMSREIESQKLEEKGQIFNDNYNLYYLVYQLTLRRLKMYYQNRVAFSLISVRCCLCEPHYLFHACVVLQ